MRLRDKSLKQIIRLLDRRLKKCPPVYFRKIKFLGSVNQGQTKITLHKKLRDEIVSSFIHEGLHCIDAEDYGDEALVKELEIQIMNKITSKKANQYLRAIIKRVK